MEAFEKIYVDGIFVIAVNLTRATINEAVAFKDLVEEEINTGRTKLVIDLSKCVYIDSVFLGTIIVVSKRLINIDSKLKVVEPGTEGNNLFNYINTIKIFDKYKSREDAIKSFDEDIQPEKRS